MKSRILLVLSLILLGASNVDAKENRNTARDGWDSREHFYKSKDSFSAYEIEYKGKIIVSDDDKSVKSISPDGYLRITKSSFGNSRKIEIESDSKGNLTKKYFDGRKEEAYSPNGEEWMEEILIDVIRKTGILNFSGNVPLSIKLSGNETASEFKGILSPGIENLQHNGVIKVFPYEYDGNEMKAYSRIILFTHKTVLDAVKADPL